MPEPSTAKKAKRPTTKPMATNTKAKAKAKAKATKTKATKTKATKTKATSATKKSPAAKTTSTSVSHGGFGPPDWGNVPPPPIEVIPTGDAAIDEALRAVANGSADSASEATAARATDEQLIAIFRGNALVPGRPFHDEALVAALTPAQKRQRNKAYWAAESEKNGRERVFQWFCQRLAKSAAGRAYLLDIAAGDHAGRVRGFASAALRESEPDAALWKQIGTRLDPASWIGAITREGSTYLFHTYAVGAVGALVTDPSAAYRRWAPLLAPAAAAASEQARWQASSIVIGIRDYVGEQGSERAPVRDPSPCVPFVPHLIALLDNTELEHFVKFALERLPHDPRVSTAIAAKIGSPTAVTYFDKAAMQLLAKSPDPTYLPYLAAALRASWMHWPAVFTGLAAMGDPRGIAIIEAWMADHDASDRRAAAQTAIDAIRAKGGEPTPAQRTEAAAMLAAPAKKKR